MASVMLCVGDNTADSPCGIALMRGVLMSASCDRILRRATPLRASTQRVLAAAAAALHAFNNPQIAVRAVAQRF